MAERVTRQANIISHGWIVEQRTEENISLERTVFAV